MCLPKTLLTFGVGVIGFPSPLRQHSLQPMCLPTRTGMDSTMFLHITLRSFGVGIAGFPGRELSFNISKWSGACIFLFSMFFSVRHMYYQCPLAQPQRAHLDVVLDRFALHAAVVAGFLGAARPTPAFLELSLIVGAGFGHDWTFSGL